MRAEDYFCIRNIVFGGSTAPRFVAVGRLAWASLLPVVSVGCL